MGCCLHVLERRNKNVAQADNLLAINIVMALEQKKVRTGTDVLVSEMLQKLQFAIRPFREDWGAEGLHDFLDSNRLRGQLIPRRASLTETEYQHKDTNNPVVR